MPSPMPLVEPVTSASFSTEEAAVVAAMIDIPAVPGTVPGTLQAITIRMREYISAPCALRYC